MEITLDNYLQLYPMFVADFEVFGYDLGNLYQYLRTGVDYQKISERVVRLNMDIDNPVKVNITTVLGADLKVGDITNSYRTCKSGLPIFFTIKEFYVANDEQTFMTGDLVGYIEFDPTEYYVKAEVI